jgi:uncharacterized protein (DUF58 family)
MYSALRSRFETWLFRLGGPRNGVVVLGRRRVFILPTRQGLTFAGVLVLMLTGSINYNLSLGFVLTFLLAAMGVNAMIHTYRNLAHLRCSGGRSRAVFAGDVARFTVYLENEAAAPRYSIGLVRDGGEPVYVDVPARSMAPATIGVRARRRGVLAAGRLTLFSHYPLGLYRAWSYLELDLHCVVYPHPASPGLPLPRAATSAGAGSGQGPGQEDFTGLRPYHLGDSPRHIAWKVAARDRGLLTKQFSGRAECELWLDWADLPAHLGNEERLSHLARWVLEAHAAGLSYGLRLPGRTIAMDQGEAHRARCLEALALFEPLPEQEGE